MIPNNDVIKCPKKIFLGCENGLSGKPKISTIVAPNDPIKRLKFVSKAIKEIKPIVKVEKIKEFSARKNLFFISL